MTQNPQMRTLQQNLDQIDRKIAESCRSFGRSKSEIRLVAVSKTHAAERVREAHACGQLWFGENYVDELLEKENQLSDLNLSWSFIGTLQSNKIQKLVRAASEIQTVASLKHARLIHQYAQELNKPHFPIFISVNICDEPQKSGIPLHDAPSLVKQIQDQFDSIHIKGLMAIPPAKFTDENFPDEIPAEYLKLAEMNRSLGLQELSLGMTQDLNIAVGAGATTLRIGTAIFGGRS